MSRSAQWRRRVGLPLTAAVAGLVAIGPPGTASAARPSVPPPSATTTTFLSRSAVLLTPGPSIDANPVPSPDGRKILFQRDFVWTVMNADGTDQHAFPMLSQTQSPTWSPDSRKFAVVGVCGTTTFCLYIADVDAGSVRSMPPSYFLSVGNWSPDGSKLLVSYPYAFSSPSGAGMYAVDVASGAATLIHAQAAGAYGEYPVGWSPDGSKILYTRQDSSGQSLRVLNSDGTADHLVLDRASTGNEQRFWSPDSTRIAVMGYSGDAVDVLIVNVDGSGAKNLTSGTEWNQVADLGGFSPDGKSVLFEESGGDYDIGQLVVARIDSQKRPEAVGVGQTPQWLRNGGIVFSTWLDVNNYNSDVYSDPKVKS